MREVVIGELTPVAQLADLLDVTRAQVIQGALQESGRLVTIYDELTFDESKVIAARFGVTARRRAQ